VLGLQFFTVTEQRTVNLIENSIANCYSTITKDGKPAGFVVGKWYVGYVNEITGQHGNKSSEIWIYTTKKIFEKLSKNSNDSDDSIESDNALKLKMWYKTGNTFHWSYRSINMNMEKYKVARQNQVEIINSIVDDYNNSNTGNVVTLLYGHTGGGKSAIGKLIALALNGTYTKRYNPTKAGDSFANFYAKVSPTKKCPLVVSLDEFYEKIIQRIMNKNISDHKFSDVDIVDKADWNNFLDDINDGTYPYVILVLSMNGSTNMITDYDPSLIRPGRVDLRFEVASGLNIV
jgi:hypothetical protein